MSLCSLGGVGTWWCQITLLRLGLGSEVCGCGAEHRDVPATHPNRGEHLRHPPRWHWMCSVLRHRFLPPSAELHVRLGFVWDCQAALFTASLLGGIISSFISCLFQMNSCFSFCPIQEIIEFPILKLNGRTMEIESTFHMYVQPVVHPQLTPFCTEVKCKGSLVLQESPWEAVSIALGVGFTSSHCGCKAARHARGVIFCHCSSI